MDTLLRDLRFAYRTLSKRPGFACAVIITLALGIGVNTAIFSVVHGVLLRPLPYEGPDRLVALRCHFPERGDFNETFSRGMYFEIAEHTDAFEQVALVKSRSLILTEQGSPERVGGMSATASCLPLLGARPALGRLFGAGDAAPGGQLPLVLSHALWERRFGGDPAVIDQLLRVDGREYTIVGSTRAGLS